MWHCFLVCGCDCMQHVPCKVFTLSGHPIQVVGAFVNPTSCHCAGFKNRAYKMITTNYYCPLAVQMLLTACVSSYAVSVMD